MNIVRMKQNISLLLQRIQIEQTLEIYLLKRIKYMKCGARFGWADRISNLEHPVVDGRTQKRGRSHGLKLLPLEVVA